jgi:hypothetical protein
VKDSVLGMKHLVNFGGYLYLRKTATKKKTNPTGLTDEVNQTAHYLHASAREHKVLVHSSEKGDGKAGKGEGGDRRINTGPLKRGRKLAYTYVGH